jgi:hypothetical protein
MRFRELIAAVKARMRSGPLIPFIGESGFHEIWTVYSCGRVAARRPHRSFGDRDFIMQRTQCNENPDFAICEIPTESAPSDQHEI